MRRLGTALPLSPLARPPARRLGDFFSSLLDFGAKAAEAYQADRAAEQAEEDRRRAEALLQQTQAAAAAAATVQQTEVKSQIIPGVSNTVIFLSAAGVLGVGLLIYATR